MQDSDSLIHRPRVFACAGPVPAPPPGHSWLGLMDAALACAKRGGEAGEVPVGALVLAPDGRVLACEHNAPVSRHDPTAHAEMLALRAAGAALGNYRLTDCLMVVTLEPCPMCAAALVHARLAGLVFGAADMAYGAVVSRGEYLDALAANHTVWHMGGVRATECADLLHDFFARRR